MKNKFSLAIQSPCHENFNSMIPNAEGAFCKSCAKNVIDLSSKTNSEVARIIGKSKDKQLCVRLNSSQLNETFDYETAPKNNSLKYAVAVAASVLLTTNVAAQEQQPTSTEQTTSRKNNLKLGEVRVSKIETNHISFELKGKLIDSNSKKVLTNIEFPMLVIKEKKSNITSNLDIQNNEFSIPLTIKKGIRELKFEITNSDKKVVCKLKINTDLVQNNILYQDFVIDSKELEVFVFMGAVVIKKDVD